MDTGGAPTVVAGRTARAGAAVSIERSGPRLNCRTGTPGVAPAACGSDPNALGSTTLRQFNNYAQPRRIRADWIARVVPKLSLVPSLGDPGPVAPIAPLEDAVAGTRVSLGGQGRALLMDGSPVATLQGPQEDFTVWRVHAGSADAVGEVIASFVGMRPCGVMIVDGGAGSTPYAFNLRKGRLCSAVGTGAFETLTKWILERDRRDRQRSSPVPGADDDERWLVRAREFVEECLLDALWRSHGSGSTILLVQGEVHWLEDEIDAQRAPDLQFLLLEYARRSDELPRLLTQVGDLEHTAIPRQALGTFPERSDAKGGKDFFDEPDAAAMLEWRDVQEVFEWCNGVATLADAINGAMVGHFRGVVALVTLVRLGAITVVDTHEDSNVLSLDALDRG